MDFIQKLKIAAGIGLNTKEDKIKKDHLEITTNDKLDEIFAKTLLQNNGNFFYCDKKEDLFKTLRSLVKKLNCNLIFCTEQILQELLDAAEIKQSDTDYANCDMMISSCEYLIAHHGKIMLSSKQLGPNQIKNLPHQHIVVAYTSQIVKNLNDAMSGINTRYIHEGLPSTITTITSIKQNTKNNTEGKYKKSQRYID